MFRNRILEFRLVPAKELQRADFNWRKHPRAQREAVRASLEQLGWIKPVIARLRPDGSLELPDGNLRQEIAEMLDPETPVPVIVTDLSEDEAHLANLILDPSSQMAQAHVDTLRSLMESLAKDKDAESLINLVWGDAVAELLRADTDSLEPADLARYSEPKPFAPPTYRVIISGLTYERAVEIAAQYETSRVEME